jgi:hypothetical protein
MLGIGGSRDDTERKARVGWSRGINRNCGEIAETVPVFRLRRSRRNRNRITGTSN